MRDYTMPGYDFFWEPVSHKHREPCPKTADSPIAPNLPGWDPMVPRFKGHPENPSECLPESLYSFSPHMTREQIFLGSMQSLEGKSKIHSQDVNQDVPYFAYPSKVPGTGPDQVKTYSRSDIMSSYMIGSQSSRFGDKGGLDRHKREVHISARTGALSLIEGEGSSLETTAFGAVTNLTGEGKICSEQFQLSGTDNDCLEFGTGSSCWEEETNETESTIDDGEGPGVFDALADISMPYRDGHSLDLVKPVLTCAKRQLVDCIMKEFWILFNQGWVGNVRKCTGSTSVPGRESSSSSDPNSPDRNQESQKSQKLGKRRRDDEPDGDPDDRSRVPERSKEESKDLDRRRLKFACPYRKHNSRKYCIQSIWRSCALTPQDTVARVKGHLYRHHRIFQCQRCKTLFDKSEEVDEHLQATKGCDLSLAEEAEGITANIEKRLRSRKKTSKDQTEEERWVEMYRLIFPGDLVPSPYFEPILEDVDQPRETELFLYEEYSRQELPRMFRDAIETLVSEGTQPLEKQLRGQLTNIIQECQDKIFSNYLSQKPRSGPSSAVIGEQTIPGTIIEEPGHEGITSNELTNFFQRPPPPQTDVVELSGSTASSSSRRYNNSTTIGYLSDTSTLPSSQDLPECTSVHHSIGSSGAAGSEFAPPLPVIQYTDNHLPDYAPFQDGGEDSTLVPHNDLLGIYGWGLTNIECSYLRTSKN